MVNVPHVRLFGVITTLTLLFWATKLLPAYLRTLARLHLVVALLVLPFWPTKLSRVHLRSLGFALLFRWKRGSIRQQPSALLLLPPELRSEIWRYLIPANTTMSKQHPRPQVPAIAHACRQTFYETLPIFFATTTLLLEVRDMDGAYTCQSVKFVMEHVARSNLQATDSEIWFEHQLIGKLCWTHLLAWAQAVHAGGWHGQAAEHMGHCKDNDVMISTLVIAEKLRKMPWKEVKAVLQTLPAAHDPRWA